MKTQAIRIERHGGPELMQVVEIDVPDPGPNQVRLKQHAAGLNFIDLYYRSGLYQAPLPHGLGSEGAGEVEAVGPGVKTLKVGDRVAYASGPLGAYSGAYVLNADSVVKLPAGIGYEQAAAMMLKGLTVQYLFRQTYLARGHGAWATIDYTKEDVVARVLELTGGAKVPVVYDSVGRDTWEKSLDCLQPRSLMVSFGNSSGPVTGVNLAILAQKGSLYVTRPTLTTHLTPRGRYEESAKELFQMVTSGKIRIEVTCRYRLEEAARAHEDLAGRRTTGSCVIIP